MLLKFYKNLLTLIILLILFGYGLKFLEDSGYVNTYKNYKDNEGSLNIFNVDKYLNMVDKTMEVGDNVLSDDVINMNLDSLDNKSLEELNNTITEFNETLKSIITSTSEQNNSN
ncbi:MAG: hypothetical protein PWP15_1193 [Methanothermococcus sp.]|jgi:hypothetical protein|uniref:hypothetical protein n=1 Tax=Methanothermococcus TaxID=155862 RepID=UPI0003646589|nr:MULTISPECIES: hypothetical protein [Methanothermococcus]MDK2790686.1 hypothetical protein [Methanothermococcus sp.]MDK2987397.1 hypothetical protein [Methanothermococcus sp.]